MSSTIAVEQLRIGMYIHLEGGWLAHPFPMSSFRIASDDQLHRLRNLGLERVRWEPEKSDAGSDVRSDLESDLESNAHSGSGSPAADGMAPALAEPAGSPRSKRADERAWLAARREAATACNRQYGEAADAWRMTRDAVVARPLDAGRGSAALTQAILDKMLSAKDMTIRLVAGGGDRAAAHAINTAVISMLIGRTFGLPADEMLDLGVGALMHDIGKLDIVDRYRHVEQGFTADELKAYRSHVARGVAHGRRMALSAGALAVLAQHHERPDGNGFPQCMRGEGMSLAARIVAVVDRYDNLCNPASRVLPLTPHEAVSMLFAQARAGCDTAVLNAFIRMMGVYPAGSLVQLTDDRYAMVVGVNSSRPLKPRVLVVGVAEPRCGRRNAGVNSARAGDVTGQATLLELERETDLGIRRSLSVAKLPPQVLAALDPQPRVTYFFEPLQTEAEDGAAALAA